MKANYLQLPEPETLIASVSANQTKAKLRNFALLTRTNLGSTGQWGKVLPGTICLIIAMLFGAAAVFAPPGLWASICAVFAVFTAVCGVYYILKFDHGLLKQIALHFVQGSEKAATTTAQDESSSLASTQIAGVQTALNQCAKELIASGSSLEEIKQQFAGTLDFARANQQVLQTRMAAISKDVEKADREVHEAAAQFEERTGHWWPSRILPGYSRALALRWLGAAEKSNILKIEQSTCSAAINCYERIAESLSRNAGDYTSAQAEIATNASGAESKVKAVKSLQNLTGCNKELPRHNEIVALVEKQVETMSASIREAIASRAANEGITEAIQHQARIVADNVRLPATFADFYSMRNGDKQLLLQQIDLQSYEFLTANPTPGRQRIRHRFVLVQGGETAPVCKDIVAASKDLLVRAADHSNPTECVVVTESRFEPCREITEYLEGVRQFRSLPQERRATMIVAVEDDDYLMAYSPENAHEPTRPLRLLTLALALGVIKRTGAECYKVVDINDEANQHFAKGFDQALDVLSTNERLSKQIEQSIDQICSVDGAQNVQKRLLEAKCRNMVPAAVGKQFREAIDEEVERLESNRQAIAA
jgi:hypothetical protein